MPISSPPSPSPASHSLDVRDLVCPLPVLRARKALRELAPGAVLKIDATDPGTVPDMAAFCEAAGHELLRSNQQDGIFHFEIRKRGG